MANPAENNMKNESPAQENKMGVMPVGKLLFTMSLPIMISMLVQALYNVVDSMFVARVSENALTALSMAFPIQNLMIAVSTGLGVGLNAVLSRALGAKDEKGVNRAATNGIMLLFICGLVFMLGGATIVRPYFEMQTDIAEIVESGVDYTTIVMLGSMGIFMQILFERLLQSTGRTLLTMVSQGVGAIANIILDPIFIFGLFGVPKMGVAGAAYATILGQWIAAAIGLVMNIRKNPEVSISMKGFRPHGATIRRILAIGIPSVVMQSIGSIMTFLMNQILIAFSATAVAVFGVYFKLQSFVFMPVFGLNNGTVPIVAYNFGARRGDRMRQTIKYSICAAVAIMIVGIVRTEAGRKAELIPNQRFRCTSAGDVDIQTVDVYDYISWKDGLLQYKKERLSVILQRLSDYYGKPIQWEPELERLTCSGKLDLKDDMEKVLNGLTKMIPVKFVKQDDCYYFSVTPLNSKPME